MYSAMPFLNGAYRLYPCSNAGLARLGGNKILLQFQVII